MASLFKIHPGDNVAVALCDLKAGEEISVEGELIHLQQDIPQAHKVALKSFGENDLVIKYGSPIAHATSAIHVGEHVSPHNIKTNLNDLDEYEYLPDFQSVTSEVENAPVSVYRRKNGDIGIRNELWIIPTVGCVNAIANMMKRELEQEEDLSAIDGIHVFTHQYGCSQLGMTI